MGLKGAGPHHICVLYNDDLLIHGTTEAEFLMNLRQVFYNVAANPKKTKFGLTQVEYVGINRIRAMAISNGPPSAYVR